MVKVLDELLIFRGVTKLVQCYIVFFVRVFFKCHAQYNANIVKHIQCIIRRSRRNENKIYYELANGIVHSCFTWFYRLWGKWR